MTFSLVRSIKRIGLIAAVSAAFSGTSWGMLASNNIPLDSPIYSYLEKLEGFGLISSDFHGIRPYTKAEAARLLKEAVRNLDDLGMAGSAGMADDIIARLKERLGRELSLADDPEKTPKFNLENPEYGRLRYVYLDGVPRSYFRPVWDPGDDGVFGIGSGLRPASLPPPKALVYQRGYEGTPLLENNEGTAYGKGSNIDLRFSLQGYSTQYLAFLVEPQFVFSANRWTNTSAANDAVAITGSDNSTSVLRINKGYVKIGGGPVELEVGRDATWFGLGERGNVTLTNNAQNLDLIKISSPEPIGAGFLGKLKYSVIFSQLDKSTVFSQSLQKSVEQDPTLVVAKLSLKPFERMEIGINFAREFSGGSFGGAGGTVGDTANSLAGIELRFRLPWLRNAELYGEFSGEDVAGPWPIVESYVAGIYFPRITVSGHDDFRFEFFQGNQILYTNTSYPAGYNYHNMPLGHSQGGATIDFYGKYRHWFTLDNFVSLEYFHTERGNLGRVTVDPSSGVYKDGGIMQAVERKDAGRVSLNLAVPGLDGATTTVMYGIERVRNYDLIHGIDQTNQLVMVELKYRY